MGLPYLVYLSNFLQIVRPKIRTVVKKLAAKGHGESDSDEGEVKDSVEKYNFLCR